MIEDEVVAFCSREYVTKESMKKLEQTIARRLNQQIVASEAPSERQNTDGDLHAIKKQALISYASSGRTQQNTSRIMQANAGTVGNRGRSQINASQEILIDSPHIMLPVSHN